MNFKKASDDFTGLTVFRVILVGKSFYFRFLYYTFISAKTMFDTFGGIRKAVICIAGTPPLQPLIWGEGMPLWKVQKRPM